MKGICFRLPFENIIILFLSTLHLSQVTHLCIAHVHNIHPSVLLRYKGATGCIQAAVMQSVKHEIIFLYFYNTVCLCIQSGSAITNLKVQAVFLSTIDIFSVVD
jgi:folate-dependent phosphoribosylglycinamide formyltransferase PurN